MSTRNVNSSNKSNKQQTPRGQPVSQGGSPQHTPSCWGTRHPSNSVQQQQHNHHQQALTSRALQEANHNAGGVSTAEMLQQHSHLLMNRAQNAQQGHYHHHSNSAAPLHVQTVPQGGVQSQVQMQQLLQQQHAHHMQQHHPQLANHMPDSDMHMHAGAEMMCTCPPELHQALLEQQMRGQSQVPLHDHNAHNMVPLDHLHMQNMGETNEAQIRIAEMEAQLSHLTAWVKMLQDREARSSGGISNDLSAASQHLMLHGYPPATDNNHTPSNSSLDSAYSAKSTTSSETSGQSSHTLPTKMSSEMSKCLFSTRAQLLDLRSELNTLRRIQESNCTAIREQMESMFKSFKNLVTRVPGGNEAPVRAERSRIDASLLTYQKECQAVDRRLGDLEAAIEDMRIDVLNRRCRVDLLEVDLLAQHLSHVSKSLTTLKNQFPKLQCQMKPVLQAEMEIVMRDEKFMKTELGRLEGSIKRCKKLTSTLFTLKRLGAVQEHSQPEPGPRLCTLRDPDHSDKRQVLNSIEAVVPDHEARVKRIQAVDELRERKKRIFNETDNLERTTNPSNFLSLEVRDVSTTPSPEELDGKAEPNCDLEGQQHHASAASKKIAQNSLPDSPQEHVTSFCSPSDPQTGPAPNGSNSSGPVTSNRSVITILKTVNSIPRNNSFRVVFSDAVQVEDSSEVLKLNYCNDDDDLQDSNGDSSSMHSGNRVINSQQLASKTTANSAPVGSQSVPNDSSSTSESELPLPLVPDPSESSSEDSVGNSLSQTDSASVQQRKVPPAPPPRRSSRISQDSTDLNQNPTSVHNDYENCDFPPPPPQLPVTPPPNTVSGNHNNFTEVPNNSAPKSGAITNIQNWLDSQGRPQQPINPSENDVWQRQSAVFNSAPNINITAASTAGTTSSSTSSDQAAKTDNKGQSLSSKQTTT